MEGRRTILHPFLGWLEELTYRVAGVHQYEEMGWTTYAKNLIWFNLFGLAFLFLLQLFQGHLPFNPENMGGISWPLALNTAVSFVTNTNWQAYAGESTMSYGTQMMGLTVQNFLSAATGSAVLMALIRGITRKTTNVIGNFWVDMVRTVIYLLLPLSFIFAIFLVQQGVVQTLSPYEHIETLEKGTQTIPLGPVASQVAIKQLGTNGGGFFNANSAHPFENPTALTNLFEMIALLAIPAAIVYSFGILIKSRTHALLIFCTMLAIWLAGYALSIYSEHHPNPITNAYPLMEGKEARFGISNSILWSTATTATANGSVNAMLESLSPIAGGVAMMNIMLGELIFGGVGVGLCSMLMFVMLTVFLCGLMVGRTPEYLGKKIEKRDVQWITLAILAPSILMLGGAGISCLIPEALKSVSSAGPHGLTELLYAFTSSAGNNGSAFAGLNANTNYFNLVLSLIMLLGRLAIIIPSLAVAGNLALKKTAPASAGTLSTTSFLFAILLIGVILIICALTFIPALSLGPIVEHLLMLEGRTFPITG